LDDVRQKLHWHRLVKRPVTLPGKESAVPAK